MVDAPIFHVNGDDPEAVAGRALHQYRQAFHNDAYRHVVLCRNGHNRPTSLCSPSPRCTSIKAGAGGEQYRDRLRRRRGRRRPVRGDAKEQLAAMDDAQKASRRRRIHGWTRSVPCGRASPSLRHLFDRHRRHAGDAGPRVHAGRVPEGFGLHKTLQRGYKNRRKLWDSGEVDWATGELLAYGSLLLEGHPIRLTGQDVQRGTFSHRHAVVTDQSTGEPYTPLNHLVDPTGEGRGDDDAPAGQARFASATVRSPSRRSWATSTAIR